MTRNIVFTRKKNCTLCRNELTDVLLYVTAIVGHVLRRSGPVEVIDVDPICGVETPRGTSSEYRIVGRRGFQ